MQKKLTISVDEKLYEGLYKKVGRRNISRFLSSLARPYILQEARLQEALEEEYRQAAADPEREAEATEWCEALIGDIDS